MNDEQIKAKFKELFDSMLDTAKGGVTGWGSRENAVLRAGTAQAAGRIVTEIIKDLGYQRS
jgi:hypothetical protein